MTVLPLSYLWLTISNIKLSGFPTVTAVIPEAVSTEASKAPVAGKKPESDG